MVILPSFSIILDEKSIADIRRSVPAALTVPAKEMVNRLSDTAVAFISGLERGIGHSYLASRWTHTPAATVGGMTSATVFSRAEDETFMNTDAMGRRSSKWTIKGSDLLAILEGGARPHIITGRNGRLMFLSPSGQSKSRFLGTRREFPTMGAVKSSFLGRGGVGVTQHRSALPDDMISTDAVKHPGVTGNQFVQAAQDLVRESLATEAMAAFRNVRVERI